MNKKIKSDYKEINNVAQKNELIRNSTGEINLVPLKILKFLISCIDTENPPDDYTVIATKRELLAFSGASGKGELSYLKLQLRSLITAIPIIDEDDKVKMVSLITDFSWVPESDYVRVAFHKDIWPYVTDLKKNFLQYNINQIKNFKSKFSLVLYEYLLSYTRQYGTKTVKIDIQTLRRVTGTSKKYKDFKDFELAVIKKAQKEINEDQYLEYIFTYEKVYEGRTVDSINFFLRKRTSLFDSLEHTEYPERLSQAI